MPRKAKGFASKLDAIERALTYLGLSEQEGILADDSRPFTDRGMVHRLRWLVVVREI